jgi:hypothetical protein
LQKLRQCQKALLSWTESGGYALAEVVMQGKFIALRNGLVHSFVHPKRLDRCQKVGWQAIGGTDLGLDEDVLNVGLRKGAIVSSSVAHALSWEAGSLTSLSGFSNLIPKSVMAS